jgi:uncharacterized protein (DUF1330 family)
MSACLLSLVRILDPERFQSYGARLAGSTERAGGRYLARGWVREVWEGARAPGERAVLVAYPDEAGPRAYAADPAVVAAQPFKAGAAEVMQATIAPLAVPPPPEETPGPWLIALVRNVEDPDGYARYAAASRAAVARAGGTYLALGPVGERIDGGPAREAPHRIVVSAWPDEAAARAFWADPAYQAARAGRLGLAEVTMMLAGS